MTLTSRLDLAPGHTATTPAWAWACPHCAPYGLLWCCAVDRATPPDVLADLARDSRMRLNVARNPSTPARVLAHLAECGRPVNTAALRNQSIPAELLARYASADDRDVRCSVAANPSTPADTLLVLVDDPDIAVCVAASANPRLPLDTLLRMAGSDRGSVGAAANPTLPVEWIRRFADSHDPGRHREAVARNRSAPPDVLERLSRDSHEWVRYSVANNRATPGHVLATLVCDEGDVREAVAWNRATPPRVLAQLADDVLAHPTEDADEEICRAVVNNPGTPVEVLLRFPAHVLLEACRWGELTEPLPAAARQIARTLATDGVQVPGRELIDVALAC